MIENAFKAPFVRREALLFEWACHWILEIHLVDRARGFGGFFEQLLDLERPAS